MIKDIAIHLTGSAEDLTRMEHAAALARTFGARLTGLQIHEMPEVLSYPDAGGSAFIEELLAESNRRAEAVYEGLDQQLGKLGPGYELRRLDAYPGQAGRLLASEARQSDLFVGTRPYGAPNKAHGVEEAVMFESGRPCLFVPPGYLTHSGYGTILVAWKDTREAARAVADALPFLKLAKSVVVAMVEEGGSSEAQGTAPAGDIGRYMSRHGIKAEVHAINGWTDVGRAILNEATKTAADLVVMGAYGHSRFREWMLGGATRDVLSSAPVPVLVSH